MKRLKLLIAAFCFAWCGSVALSAADTAPEETCSLMIADFEDPAQAEKFIPMKGNPQKVTHVSDPALVISGKGSGCWYVPVAGEGEHQWPRATMTLPPELSNWDLYDQIEVDIFNPLDTEARFCCDVYDDQNHCYTPYTQPVAAGRSVFRWKFDEKIRGRKLVRFMLVTGKPIREYTLYIDNIRLTTTRSSFMARVAHQLIRLRGDWQESEWQRAGMYAEFQQFEKRLQALQKSSEPLEKLLKEFGAISQDYEKAKSRLIAKLNALPIAEFDRTFPAPAVWGYGWTTGMQKIYRADLPYQGKIGGSASLSLARRESEGVQIVLRSRQKLEHVKLTVGELKQADGTVLPAESITVYPVGHLKTRMQGYPADYAEWRPDPLLGYLKEIPLDENVWQAFFIDVAAAAKTPAGLYQGSIKATAAGAPDLTIPLAVRVWNFTIPEDLTQPRLVNFNSDGNHWSFLKEDKTSCEQFNLFREDKLPYDKLSANSRKLWDMELRIRDLMLDHLVSPISLYITKRRHKIYEIADWDSRRGSWYNITYVPPRTGCQRSALPAAMDAQHGDEQPCGTRSGFDQIQFDGPLFSLFL